MLLALLIAGAAPAAAPQLPLLSDPRIAEALGPFDPHPGAWVEYALLPKRGAQVRVRIAVLSPALPDGRYWLETATQMQGGPPLAMRLLLHGPPGRPENIDRLQVYMAGQAPLELPLEDARAAVAKQPKQPLKVERKGTQEVKVAPGSFRCDVVQVKDARLFHSGKVPLWGLVREEDPRQRLELLGYADSGAETVFPKEFDQGNGSESTK